MRYYYLIPTTLELLAAQLQALWLASSETAFICISGIYASSLVQNQENQIDSNVMNQLNEYIPNSLTAINESGQIEKRELQYFLLETGASINQMLTELGQSLPQQVIDMLIEFTDNIDLINYLNENNLR